MPNCRGGFTAVYRPTCVLFCTPLVVNCSVVFIVVHSTWLKMLNAWNCRRTPAFDPICGTENRRASVMSQLLHDGLRRIPTGVLPKLPTVELIGWAMANAAGLKWIAV